MENEFGITAALVGVASIIVLSFISVVFFREIKEREKEELAKIKACKVELDELYHELDELHQEKIDKTKKEKSKHDTKVCSSIKHNTKETQAKPVKKRVSKYNNENTLYIAYDFNILNNESYLDIRKKIINLKDDTKLGAIKTTSVIFLNSAYLDIFTDIILIKKSGVSISLRKLINEPSYYINKNNVLAKLISNKELLLDNAEIILQNIHNGSIKFKREK